MTQEELKLLEDMYEKAMLASDGEGAYIDANASEKAKVLKRAIELLDIDKVDTEQFIYKTSSRRDFLVALNSWKLLCSIYDVLCWNRSLYNGKDYGKGHTVYRGKLITTEEWERRTSPFSSKTEEDHIKYDWERKVFIDKDGEVPGDSVFHVYTKDDIVDELEDRLREVSDFVYRSME